MTRRKTRHGPAASPAPAPIVGKSKREAQAIAKFGEVVAEHNSHLSPGLGEQDKMAIFAQSFAYILRDDWHGSKLFDMPDLGRVLNLLFKSAGIQASWKEIGYLEKNLDQLIPDMPGLVVKLLAYKTIKRGTPIFAQLDELLPDRFLVAVFESFKGDKPSPEFFTAKTEFDPNNHKTTDFTNLLWINGK